ncbi:hypothetical protein WN944_000831 [Citrus x changshan-huyou]|uniref:Uncharacterized protein n=1 Tax=Citrus x changshan-huyou TaxID=2935761 RepID=A0AAP0MFC8_9ROSI
MARILMLDFQLDCLDTTLRIGTMQTLIMRPSSYFRLLIFFFHAYKGESLFMFARDVTLKSTKAMMQPPIPKDLDPWGFRLLRASWTKISRVLLSNGRASLNKGAESPRGVNEFDLEFKDKKDIKDVVADHLSRFNFDTIRERLRFNESFADEQLMSVEEQACRDNFSARKTAAKVLQHGFYAQLYFEMLRLLFFMSLVPKHKKYFTKEHDATKPYYGS